MSKRAKKSQQAEEQTPPTLRGATAHVILLDEAASFSPPEEKREDPKPITVTTHAPRGVRFEPLTDQSSGIEPPFALSYMRRVPSQEKEGEESFLIPSKTEGSLSMEQMTLFPENLAQAFSQPPREEKVRALAYDLWLQRGSPIGSPETDWLEAERLTP